MSKLTGRHILLTGATGGLGSALAHHFAREGATLYLMARDRPALEALDDSLGGYGVPVTLIPLNLREMDGLSAIGDALQERTDRLDAFVANAGMLGSLSPLTHQDPQDWMTSFATHVHANFFLLRALEPLLMNSASPRVVYVTSSLGFKMIPYWGAYALSKATGEMMFQLYAAEKAKTPLRVNCIDPGVMRTKLFAKAMPGVNLETIPLPQDVTHAFVYAVSEACDLTGQLIKAKEFSRTD
jgi:NAD(P)-dependent dehydrogenase (short-subunit alcohol dehydrogenase family)